MTASLEETKNVIFLGLMFLNELKSIESASDHTLRAYARDLNQFFADKNGHILKLDSKNQPEFFFKNNQHFSEISVFSPKPITSAYFLKKVSEALQLWSPLSASSRNRKLSTLKSFSKWLARKEFMDTDVSHRIPIPKVPQKIPHFLSVDEMLSLIASLKIKISEGTSGASRDLTLVYLLYGMGLRVSEACRLQWKDIQWGQSSLLVTEGKGGQQRWVAIPGKVLDFLKIHHDMKPSGAVYILAENKPMDSRTAYDRVRNAGIQAGLSKPLNPHALRHSFATHLLSSGSDLRVLQEMLGHHSLVATQKYTHLSLAGLSRVMETSHPLGEKESKT